MSHAEGYNEALRDLKSLQILHGEAHRRIVELEARLALLEAVYEAVKDWPESEQTMVLRYALADMENKR